MGKKNGCGFVSVCFLVSILFFLGLTAWIMMQVG